MAAYPSVDDFDTDSVALLLSGTASITLTVPAGANTGDLLLVFVSARDNATAPTLAPATPGDWTQVGSTLTVDESSAAVFYRIVEAGEPASHDFDASGGSALGGITMSGGMLLISGISEGDPIGDVETTTGALGNLSLDMSAVTHESNNDLVVAFGRSNNSTDLTPDHTWGAPGEGTEVWDFNIVGSTIVGHNQTGWYANNRLKGNGAFSHDWHFALADSREDRIGFLVVVRPATSGVSPSGSVGSSGAIIKRPSRSYDGDVSPAGDVHKGPKTNYSGVGLSSGATRFMPKLIHAGSITPTGAYGPTIVHKLLSGLITPTGALTKFITQFLSGAVSAAGALTRIPGKVLAGTITSAGAYGPTIVHKLLTGAAISTGTLTRFASRIFSGAVTGAGTLTRIPKRIFVGTVTSAGGLIRTPGKLVSGTITPTGTYGPTIVHKLLTGTVTATGTLTKSLTRFFSGAITSSGALTRIPKRIFSGTITATGSLSRIPKRVFSGAVASTGALIKAITHAFSGSTTPTGALIRKPKIILAGSITPTSTLATRVIAAGIFLSGLFRKLLSLAGLHRSTTTLSGSFATTITLAGLHNPSTTLAGRFTTDISLSGSYAGVA